MLENYKQPLLDNLFNLVRIPSVLTEGESHPLGDANFKCATEIVKLMDSLGFKTYMDPDGYYAYAEVGEGDLFGILGHLDVVPAEESEGWITPPFEPKIIDGAVYGRGVQDDKGPALASVFAVKALMDEGYEFKYKMRFIFGFNEETNWECITKYKANEEAPSIGFTPDSAFPVVYAEKGLVQYVVTKKVKSDILITGGSSFNAVPSKVTTKANDTLVAELTKLGYEFDIDGENVVVKGKSAHAKNPWKGDSAVYKLCTALENIGVKEDAINFVNKHFNEKHVFEGFSSEDLSDFSGPVSINLGQIFVTNDEIKLHVDVRHPVTVEMDKITEIITKVCDDSGFDVKKASSEKAIYLPLDSELISNMIATYQEVTGDLESKPIVSGGATYARAFDNCVAFGPNFPNKPSTEHMPNENIPIDQLMQTLEIYYKFIKKVCVK